jgi:hypothetical protein
MYVTHESGCHHFFRLPEKKFCRTCDLSIDRSPALTTTLIRPHREKRREKEKERGREREREGEREGEKEGEFNNLNL